MKSILISVYPDVVNTIDEATKIATDISEKVFDQHDTAFIVHTCDCDNTGVCESERIDVFYTYEQLNDKLNSMQYVEGTSIDAYYATKDYVISMVYKTFDCMSYDRYSAIGPITYETTMWRRFMDRPCRVRIATEI